MSVERNDAITPERYRAAAAFLISMPIYACAISAAWIAFGFWQMAVLAVLFRVVKGNRVVCSLTAHWVRNLSPSQKPAEKTFTMRRGPKKEGRPASKLVIEHDPLEFKRSYR